MSACPALPRSFIAFAAFFLSVAVYQPTPHRSTEEMQVKKLKVNDVELAYVEEGKGETVVFVHGGGVADLRNWEVLRPFISGKFHYVSLSRRYHYPNPWMDDGRNYTMAQHVEDVAAFIHALKVGKVHLVGNSYGGGVVGRVALKYPELLRSVVVGEGLIDPVSAEAKAAVAAAQKQNAKRRQAVEAGDLREAAILTYDNALGEQGAFEKLPPERQEQLLYNAKTYGPEQRAPTPLTCEQLRTLSVPALLIRGEKTGALSRHHYEMTIGCLPKTAEAAIIPGAPHSWYLRNPEDSAKAILTFIAKHAQTPTRTWELPAGVNSLLVNGYDMAYVEKGTGQPLVLVHGTLGDLRSWAGVMDPLSAKYRVIAVSLRHYYPERWNGQGGDFSMRQHVADVVAFIQKLDAGPVHLVGHSRGAHVALYIARADGELVRTITLAEPAGGIPALDDDPQRRKQLFEKAAAIFERGNVEGSLEYFIDSVNGPGSWKAIPEAGRQAFRDNASTMKGEVRDTWDLYTCADAGRVGAPVLLVAGEKSPPFFGKILDAVQRCLTRSERVVVPNASHGIPRQNPAGFSEAVLNFISNHRNSMSGHAAPQRSTDEMQVKKLKVSDVELAYVEEGKGETVVFVHGFAGDWRTWESLRPFISDKYHHVSLSRRYHYPNRWTDDGRNYSITQHVEDVAAFVRALNVGKVHLVGNSYGGRIAGYVALKYPELVRSVVLGEPSIISSDSAEAKAARTAAEENRAKVVAAMKAGDATKAMRLFYDAIAGGQGAWEKLPVERQRQLLDNARTVIPTWTGARAIPVTCEELSALSVPALVIGGETSSAHYRYGNEALLRCLPKTTAAAVIPGAHHEWHTRNLADSAKAILTFIARR